MAGLKQQLAFASVDKQQSGGPALGAFTPI